MSMGRPPKRLHNAKLKAPISVLMLQSTDVNIAEMSQRRLEVLRWGQTCLITALIMLSKSLELSICCGNGNCFRSLHSLRISGALRY